MNAGRSVDCEANESPTIEEPEVGPEASTLWRRWRPASASGAAPIAGELKPSVRARSSSGRAARA